MKIKRSIALAAFGLALGAAAAVFGVAIGVTKFVNGHKPKDGGDEPGD